MAATDARNALAAYELRFHPLFEHGRALAFPCDHRGRVDLDGLGPRARVDYFYARTVIGREFARPAVAPTVTH